MKQNVPNKIKSSNFSAVLWGWVSMTN